MAKKKETKQGKIYADEFEVEELKRKYPAVNIQKIVERILNNFNRHPFKYFDRIVYIHEVKEPLTLYNLDYQDITEEEIKTEQEQEPLEVMTVRNFDDYKEPKNWIIKDIIYPKETAMIYAPTNSLKSMIILYQAVCIASGRKYLNHFKVKQSPVLFLSGEDGIKTTKMRLRQIRKGLGLRKKDIPLYILPRNKCQDLYEIEERITNFIIENKIKVLYLDTGIMFFSEFDDNKAKDVIHIFKLLKKFNDDLGVHITFLHHTTKVEQTYLGSMKWKGLSDVVWRVSREKLSNHIKVYNEKAKTGEQGTLKIELKNENPDFKKSKKTEFILLSQGDLPEIFSKDKKMTQAEFFKLKLNELCRQGMDRVEIFSIFTKHKIKFSRASLDRAISIWRTKK